MSTPLLFCIGDAAGFLGMSRQEFDRHVRPRVREAKLEKKVMFHRVDLEHWAENYMAAAAEPGVCVDDAC